MRTVQLTVTASRRHRGARWAAVLGVTGALAFSVGVAGASSSAHGHARGVTISAFKSAKAGTILVDGTSLYTLKSRATACAATCHKYWIPVLLPKGVTRATAGTGVSAAKLGTVKVAGGRQVTYGGKALFWFFEDTSLGQVKGNVTDTWGEWADVVLAKPMGAPSTTTSQPAKSTTTTTTTPVTTTTRPTTTTTVPGGGGGVGF